MTHPGLIGEPIYLDYNATTPVDPRVVDALLPHLTTSFGNPSSSYSYGTDAKAALTTARTQLAALIGAQPGEVVFTGSGSEANLLALRGMVLAARGPRRHVITQATEHPAVLETCRALHRLHGVRVTVLPVDSEGLLDPAALAAALDEETVLVSVASANNETGTLQPIAELAEAAHRAGALFHTDAAQAAGKIPVAVGELGVDLLTVVGHKMYAPKGIAALYVRDGVQLEPVVYGGGQERGIRSGTENVALAVALGAAAQLATDELASGRSAQLADLRDLLHQRMRDALPGRVHLNGAAHARLPNTLNVSIDQIQGHELLAAAGALAASTVGLPQRSPHPVAGAHRDGPGPRARPVSRPDLPWPLDHPRRHRDRGSGADRSGCPSVTANPQLNPTIRSVEAKLADLEGGEHALAFSSGMAAEAATFLAHTRTGEHIVCIGDVYGGTFELFCDNLPQLGITTTFLRADEVARLPDVLTATTRVVFFETPSNPTLDLFDIAATAAPGPCGRGFDRCRQHFTTPIDQNPLVHGADLVIHSATKYLGGHSDPTAGALIGPAELLAPVAMWRKNLGQVIATAAVATFLASHPRVGRVNYPGLATGDAKRIFDTQMRRGGMLSAVLDATADQTAAVVDRLRLFAIVPSLGGVESLITQPITTTHHGVAPDERAKRGIADSMIRLSVGLEDADDLIADLAQALDDT